MANDKPITVKIAAFLLAITALIFLITGAMLALGTPAIYTQILGILYLLFGIAGALGVYWLWKMKRQGAAIGIAISTISIAAAIVASGWLIGLFTAPFYLAIIALILSNWKKCQ